MTTPPEYISAPENAPVIADGAAAAAFWRERVMTLPQFNPANEWTVTLLLDAERKLLGHLAPESDGSGGWVYFPRAARLLGAVFMAGAASVVLMHSHPGEDLRPSEDDRNAVATGARWMELIERKLSDFVIVNPGGDSHHSLAESGELAVRAVVLHEFKWKTWEEGLDLSLACLEAQDSRIGPIVTELAAASGVSRAQWFADWALGAFLRGFSPEPLEDRRLCLLGAVYSRSLQAGEALSGAARQAGVGLSQFIWQEAVDVTVKKWEPTAAAAGA